MISNRAIVIMLFIFSLLCACTKDTVRQSAAGEEGQKENNSVNIVPSNIKNNSGIVLSFDDYFPDSWEENFELFDKYNAKVTFFVQLESPTQFCFNAQERGHEIGYHTISHLSLLTLSRKQFYRETISRINVFKDKRIDLTSFAYPFGYYEEWMNDELLKHYKIVRGFNVSTCVYTIPLPHGFVYSKSIDNVIYKQETNFQNDITQLLEFAKENQNSVILLTSHNIGSNDWGITKERLEFILKKCVEYDMKFYTYKDLF